MVNFIITLLSLVCFIIATIVRAKISAIISEYERSTKKCISPTFYTCITILLVSLGLGCIGCGLLIGYMI